MKQLSFLAILVVFLNCKDTKKTDYSNTDSSSDKNLSQNEVEYPGKKIMETECYLCHSPSLPEEGRIAPPMIAIKMHYINDSTTKEEFQNDLVEWINHPSEEKSKMPGALKRFGIMPFQPYPEETIKLIADYLYDNEIEEPEWFQEHYSREHGQGKGMGKGMGQGMGMRMNRMGQYPVTDYSDIGLKYALSTKAQLSKNLMKAIQEKGTVGAVEFCNLRAMNLTDSMAAKHNAIIKRVSDKPRNPDNMANEKELDYITVFKEQIAIKGIDVEPIVEEINGKVNFYYPITTNNMCLQCHGQPNNQVTAETLTTLKMLYPKDKATGYDTGQVRGIWSINFDTGSVE